MGAKPRVFIRFSARKHEVLSLLDANEFEVVPIERQNPRLLLQRTPSRLVLAEGADFDGLVGLFASIYLRCPLVVRLRGNFYTEQKEIAGTERGLTRYFRLLKLQIKLQVIRRASAVVFNSCYLREYLGPLVPKIPQYVVENPVTVSDEMLFLAEEATNDGVFSDESIRLRLLTLTNMEAYGKVMGLVRAINWFGEGPLPEELRGRILWSIYGKGRYSYLIKEAIASTGLQSVVQLNGYTRQAAKELDHCDVLAHFTNLDAFPNATLEAMYFRKPIITNEGSCGTLEQVEHGRSGFIVKCRDDLIAALLEYLYRPDLREIHGNEGRKLLEERYTSQVLTRQMSDTLMGVLQRLTRETPGADL